MAKPKKNKAGLHKHVSSVLEGVRIPQGVHNWRPPDESALEWTGYSPGISRSSISSVFDGLSPLAANDYPEPTRERAQDHLANTVSIQTPEADQTSHNNMADNLDSREESLAKPLRTDQPEPAYRVAYYRELPEEAPRRSLWERVRERLFGAND